MRALPTWSEAQVVVSHGGLSIGIFSSTKPWMPRHKERRFLAVGQENVDPEESPHGGAPLLSLRDSVNRTIEEQHFVLLAGEAEGHMAVTLHAGGEGWTVVVAADAWIALGPRASGPQGMQIGPHMLDLTHLDFGSLAAPSAANEGSAASFEVRVID